MKYVMLIGGPVDGWDEVDEEQAGAEMEQITAWMEKQGAAGAIAFPGYQLDSPATARTISPGADGSAIVTDGPYVEAKEALGGFVVLETETVDQAVEAASEWVRINPSWVVELRPTFD